RKYQTTTRPTTRPTQTESRENVAGSTDPIYTTTNRRPQPPEELVVGAVRMDTPIVAPPLTKATSDLL
ncbi:hypothetical protein A2U01_0098998, partial [Trifolium medium]|nr:hypothetical protein [Trifolium medium]